MEAPRFAGLSLVRHNIPGEVAHQLLGPDSAYPNKIFTSPQGESYYLADAGSQWVTALALSQKILAFLETGEPDNGWSGNAFAGAVQAALDKAGYARSLIQMPEARLGMIPAPELLEADESHIRLKLAGYADESGLAQALALWRRAAGSQAWTWLGSPAL